MDDAEQWLAENDPDYESTGSDWRHVDKDGEGRTPGQEIPVGLDGQVTRLEETGRGEYVDAVPDRACVKCYEPFGSPRAPNPAP